MNENSSDEDQESLEAMRAAAAEDRRFYSNLGKEERERWVVQEFLHLLAVGFDPCEIQSQEQSSKIDVTFRDAAFQIKEMTDPFIRRDAEIRDTHNRLMKARTLSETLGPGFIYDTPEPCSGYGLIRDMAEKLAADHRYAKIKSSLDLLIYVTRSRVSLVQLNEIDNDDLRKIGWRSISSLMGRQAMVIHANSSAPNFLRNPPRKPR